MDSGTVQVPEQLLEQLTEGYDALRVEYKLLNAQRQELESKLSWATQQHLELLKRFVPDVASSDYQVFLDELLEAGACQQNGEPDWLESLSKHEDGDRRTRAYNIRQADGACERLQNRCLVPDADGVRIWNGPSADKPAVGSSVNGRFNTDSSLALEQDFTTAGTPSRLRCPFVPPNGRKMSSHAASVYERHSLATPRSSTSRLSAQARRSKRPSFNDPIRAEICGNDPTSSAPSVEGSAAVCPIRFLDQHSPEEVAKYFENHKHEIPRSHEVCVKRYQSNAESIRQLDAKYGNLVSMIQGLGVKHQAWLPEKPEDEEAVEEQRSADKVKKWAKAVSATIPDGEQKEEAVEHEERQPHFDRPLKDVRVGESPSRPWGISVPTKYQKASSAASDRTAEAAPPEQKPEGIPAGDPKPARCPFGHGEAQEQPLPNAKDTAPESKQQAQQQVHAGSAFIQPPVTAPATNSQPSAPPQMVFTGPVFIGYSVEQAVALLQQSGLGQKT